MTFGYNSGTGYVKPLIRRQEGVLPLSNYLLNGTSSDHTLLWGVVFFYLWMWRWCESRA